MKKILFSISILLPLIFISPVFAVGNDKDLDGIENKVDICSETAAYSIVDTNGCSCEQKQCPTDFACIDVLGSGNNPSRAQCLKKKNKPTYDLSKALEDALNVNTDDKGFVTPYPQHLVGTGEQNVRGDVLDFTTFFRRFANALTLLAGSLAVLFLIINAFVLVTSAGDSDRIGTAKKGILWSIIGLFVIIMSYVIVKTTISLTYSGQEFEVDKYENLTSDEKVDKAKQDITALELKKSELEREIDESEKEIQRLNNTQKAYGLRTTDKQGNAIPLTKEMIQQQKKQKEDAGMIIRSKVKTLETRIKVKKIELKKTEKDMERAKTRLDECRKEKSTDKEVSGECYNK